MELSDTGLHKQPFPTHGQPVILTSYAANAAALDFLKQTYEHKHGLGLVQGPTLSGKSTVAHQFLSSLDSDVSKALVDGTGLNTTELLEAILGQFGYRLELTSLNELISMLRVFAMQQTVAGNPPCLIIENTHALKAGALRVLCDLADIRARREHAIRIVLMSDRSIEGILQSPAMEAIKNRVTGKHVMSPMTSLETRDYLHAKLDAAGADEPAKILPDVVCADIFSASNGWPGVADRLALLALANAEEIPVSSDHVARLAKSPDVEEPAPAPSSVPSGDYSDGHPRLFLTRGGKTLGEIKLDRPRLLIGRSEHNDLRINSNFISRHHMMFVRHGSATLLMDLNSTNGTYVNSRRVSNYVMMHDDVVSVGNHRIKFVHPAAETAVDIDDEGAADTVIMKTLEDMRKLTARENTQTMPMQAMDKLVSGDSDS